MPQIWTQKTGTTLGTFAENDSIRLAFPLNTTSNTISTVKVITGSLPPGLRIDGLYILGTPFEVERLTEFKFVVRATDSTGAIEDRTFTILINGADEPVWITKEGILSVDPDSKYFVLDNTVLDFQLKAIDSDLPAGDTLEYFIEDDEGQLPPGVQLTKDGRIVGVVEPVLALDARAGSGKYDANIYGTFPFDFGERSANGYDSFFFDTRIYDDRIPTKQPRKLNRYYEFIVTVSDGDTFKKRKFQIYLVGDDFLRADNTKMQLASGLFSADNTYLRTPVWLTPGDLGYRRANNFLTFFLDVLDTETLAGRLVYTLETLNDDGSPSTLPPGMDIDSSTGEIAGRVPYQPAVTREYKFTVKAQRLDNEARELATKTKTFTVKILGEVDSTIKFTTLSNLGNISANFISTLSVEATTTVPDSRLLYSITKGSLPNGLTLDITGEIIGKVNQFGSVTNPGLTVFDSGAMTFDGAKTVIDRKFTFTVKAQDRFGFSAVEQEFTLDVLDPDDNLYSNLYMKPFLKQTIRDKYQTFVSNPNIFPPDLIYRSGDTEFGVQKDVKMLAYAGILTQNIRNYVAATAKNHKRKTFKLGSLKKAVAKNPGSNDIVYEVIYVEIIDPYMPTKGSTAKTIRSGKGSKKITVDSVQFEALDDNTALGSGVSTFDLGIRGSGDPSLQVQTIGNDLEIITRSGRVVFPTVGDIKVTLRSGSQIVSEQKFEIKLAEPDRFRPISNTIKIDSDAINVSQSKDNKKYISNIKNMRDQISATGETERDFLPLWMRTAQENSVQELGYITAIPIVYCKAGNADQILLNIKNDDFDFKDINFDIDRYIVDSTTGNGEDQYILFANYEYNI